MVTAMIQMAPPRLPIRLGYGDGDGLIRTRTWQLVWTTVTVLVTTWMCTLGWIPAILALVTAKHVLVAILVMGLGVDARTGQRAVPDEADFGPG